MLQFYYGVSSNFNKFITLASTRLRLPEDDADALKHVGILTIYGILLIYIYVYVVHLLVWIIKNLLLVYFSGSQ